MYSISHIPTKLVMNFKKLMVLLSSRIGIKIILITFYHLRVICQKLINLRYNEAIILHFKLKFTIVQIMK